MGSLLLFFWLSGCWLDSWLLGYVHGLLGFPVLSLGFGYFAILVLLVVCGDLVVWYIHFGVWIWFWIFCFGCCVGCIGFDWLLLF